MSQKKPLTYSEAVEYGRRLLDEHGLHDWRIFIENLGNTALYGPTCAGLVGKWDGADKTIRIDFRMRRSFRQTLLHEIAHASTPADNCHGDEWVRKAEEIGCTAAHIERYAFANAWHRKFGTPSTR
jgi:hypothetical protein